ncbi:hypothetical protein [Salinarimonas sp.]|uniref:hypothetical protein n=1 Tax=Salinarimonas sp. TaxID=2766526 RepID=UPI00391B0EC0
MRATPITGMSRSPSITDTVERGRRILAHRPEPRGRDRDAERAERRAERARNQAARSDAQPEAAE